MRSVSDPHIVLFKVEAWVCERACMCYIIFLVFGYILTADVILKRIFDSQQLRNSDGQAQIVTINEMERHW